MTRFFLGVSKPEDRAMHAAGILRRCLSCVFDPMHAARSRRLLQAIEALVQGRRLTLTDLSRSWPGALLQHAPLKALGRWWPCASLHEQARPRVRDLGSYAIVKGDPLPARLVRIRSRRSRGRPARSLPPTHSTHDQKCIKRAREPWLLVTSLHASCAPAAQIVTAYAKRMQIEEAFRDLKSGRYGVGFEHSSTRRAPRLAVLLLLHTLTRFATWLMGLAQATVRLPDPLTRQRSHHRRYSQQRRSLEWLRRTVLPPDLRASLTPTTLKQLVLAADYS